MTSKPEANASAQNGDRTGSDRMATRKAKTADQEQMRRASVLSYLAERLGPVIDQIDIVGQEWLRVRDVLLDLGDRGVGSPAELRSAMSDLAQAGMIGLREGDVTGQSATIELQARGLVEARKSDPNIGRPCVRVTLTPRKGSHEFAARVDTGSPDRDRRLNKSGVALAVFYVLALEQPSSDKPITVDRVQELAGRLAVLGIGPKSGPGPRIDTSAETIRKALGDWSGVLGLRTVTGADRRAHEWYLAAGFPEVRLVGTRGARRPDDWRLFLQLLRQEIRGRARDPKARPGPN